jgi:hypothetical protein
MKKLLILFLLLPTLLFANELTNNLCKDDEEIAFGCVAYGNITGIKDPKSNLFKKLDGKLTPISVCKKDDVFRYVYKLDGEDVSEEVIMTNPNHFKYDYVFDGKMFNYFLGNSYIFYEEIDEPYSFADTVVGTCVETKEKNHLNFTKRYDGLTPDTRHEIGSKYPKIYNDELFKEYRKK